MTLGWNLNGPQGLQGDMYSACGTSVVITAGLPVAYSAGLAIQNPSTSTKKITILRLGYAVTGTGGTQGAPWGFAKLTNFGTATANMGATFSGPVFRAGSAGTSATSAYSAILAGTCTLSNGTAGPNAGVNAWAPVMVGGNLGAGTGNVYSAGGAATLDLSGEIVLLPGETGIMFSLQGVIAGLPSITWLEQGGPAGWGA